MSRALLVLANQSIRDKACHWIRKAPENTRVEFRKPKRTLPQNDRLHAMITDWAEQVEHHGQKYDVDSWKVILLSAFGYEVRFVPSLDGTSFVPLGMHTSDLSKEECTEFMDFIEAEGALRGVTFHEPGTGREAA